MTLPVVDVAVNVVRSPDGQVLLAERTARQVAGGFWEMPGGKIDPGETPAQAAARELEEEIGIVPTRLLPWITYEHAFRTKRVRLHLFHVAGWRGTPHGCEGQRLAWTDPSSPVVGPVLPSNDRALAALGLPAMMLEADPLRVRANDLRAALSAGARLLRLRTPGIPGGQSHSLARRCVDIAHAYDARVLLSGSVSDMRRAGADGMHSHAAELSRLSCRPAVPSWSVSCHDADDLARAAALGADLAVVSPVLACDGTQARPLLGWDGLLRLTAGTPLPVYARGGLGPGDLRRAEAAGCVGLACSYEAGTSIQ